MYHELWTSSTESFGTLRLIRLILIANIANARIWLMSWNSQVGRARRARRGGFGETALPS